MSWEDNLDIEIQPRVAVDLSLGQPSGQVEVANPSDSAAITESSGELLSVDNILSIFQSAKQPTEILSYAKDCSTPVWLDWIIKLTPKKINHSGQIDLRAAFINLGPPQKAGGRK